MAYLIPTELFDIFNWVVFATLLCYTISCAYLAVTVKNIYHSVIYLIFTLLGIGVFFLLYAESALLLVIQLIVYTGGITILMLFAIALSGKDSMFEREGFVNRLFDWKISVGGIIILLFIIFSLLIQVPSSFLDLPSNYSTKPSESELIGQVSLALFTGYGGLVVLLSLLLLAAMIGAVYLVKKEVDLV